MTDRIYKWGWYSRSKLLHLYSLNFRGTDALTLCDPLYPIPVAKMRLEDGGENCKKCLKIKRLRGGV